MTITEEWQVAAATTETDDNGLISDFDISWHTFYEFNASGDFYDAYEGAASGIYEQDGQQKGISYDALHAAWEEGHLLEHTTILDRNFLNYAVDVSIGITPFRVITVSDDEASNEGFSVAWQFGTTKRPWFDGRYEVTDYKIDYDTHYGGGAGEGSFGDLSKTRLEEQYDRRPEADYDFVDTFNELVDGYVTEIYAVVGSLNEPSITYKKSTKKKPTLSKLSSFDKGKIVGSTGAAVSTATTATTVTGGSYSY